MWELYSSSDNRFLMVENLKTRIATPFNEMPLSWIKSVDQAIKRTYPETWNELADEFGELPAKAYKRAYSFCACNFSSKDGHIDIDEEFNFIIETVFCPVRHLCKRSTCSPKLSSNLTKRELDVVRLFVKSFSEEEIAERLFIETCTVHNHINNIYEKTGFRGSPNPDRRLITYALKHNIT